MTRLLSCLLAIALLIPVPVAAWGPLGHRLIAGLAWDGMTPEARAEALALLEGEDDPTLAGVANWADQLRAEDPDLGRRSARWHYVNIAEDDCHYTAARHCKGGNCVVEAINDQAAILADRSRPRAERLQALKFVVHFVGDVHQPLHAGHGHDKGGNTVQVSIDDGSRDGRGSNLHALWDSGLLNSARLDEAKWLARLRTLPAAVHVSDTGSAARWAEASCRAVIQPGFYPAGPKVGRRYMDQWRPVAEAQLRAGGQRLADMLNAALADPQRD